MTSIRSPELPEPRDAFDEKLLEDVRRHGWHCVMVADEHHPEHAAANAALLPHPVYDAAFAYTVGLGRTYSHPELILVGRWQFAHQVIANVVQLIGDGQHFAAGDRSDEVLMEYEVSFGAVSDLRRLELLTCADWLNRGAQFEALQLILPDKSGAWPDEPTYDAYPQPLLA
jgi:hypothetical protein